MRAERSADVSGGDPSPSELTGKLRAPNWVPRSIAFRAGFYHQMAVIAGNTEEAALVSRLATHPRMKCVWAEFFKKTRGGESGSAEFLHKPNLANVNRFLSIAFRYARQAKAVDPIGIEDSKKYTNFLASVASACELLGLQDVRYLEEHPDQVQEDIVCKFFMIAFERASGQHGLASKAQIRAGRAEYTRAANRIRSDADILRRLGMTSEAEELQIIASKCQLDSIVVWPEDDERYTLVHRHTQGKNLRYLVLSLAKHNRKCFGKTLVGTITTTAQVALNRPEIRVEQVRSMVRTLRTLALKPEDVTG
jgi:hypothetical protein